MDRRAARGRRAVLGVCLGAQIMARVLGARVFAHPDDLCEVGYHPLAPAKPDCPLFPSPFHAFHWHREGFDLPPGAELLARGVIFENQAFSVGTRAFGVQFHPEMTSVTHERWLNNPKAQKYFLRPEVPPPSSSAPTRPATTRWCTAGSAASSITGCRDSKARSDLTHSRRHEFAHFVSRPVAVGVMLTALDAGGRPNPLWSRRPWGERVSPSAVPMNPSSRLVRFARECTKRRTTRRR